MSTKVAAAVVAVALLVVAGFVTLVYPIIYRDPLADPFLEIDNAEEKAWLDSQIVIEIRGSYSAEEIRESLKIHPPVPLGEEDLAVEHIAKFPWHEGFAWAKTRVVINPHKSRLFEPETSYTVALKGEDLAFETITLPRVVSAYVDSVPHNDFKDVPTSSPIVLVFNEEVVWQDEWLDVAPYAEVTTTVGVPTDDGTKLWVIPKDRWENSTTYALTIREGVKDIFGHEGVQEFSLDFTTWPPPRVVEATPIGSDLPLDSTVRVKFERPVDRQAVEEAFEVEPSVSGNFEWENDWVLRWKPSDLAYSTTYTVSVGGEAIGGDPILPSKWAFATHDPPVFVEIEGSDQSPTFLRTVASGGTGEYSYKWSSGETGQEIWVDLWYEEIRTFEVTVTSGDQTATAELLVSGPPSPCPGGWEIITADVCYKEEVLPGPVQVFLARVDLQDSDLQLHAAPAADYLGQLGTVSESAQDRNTLVSTNGDFFRLGEGEYFTQGPIVSGGNLIYAPASARVVLALDRDLRSWVGQAEEFEVYFAPVDGEPERLQMINSAPGEDSLALFNAYWGRDLSLDVNGCYGLFAPTHPMMNTAYQFSCGAIKNIPLRAGEFVLVGTGEAADWMKQYIEDPLDFRTSFPIPSVDFMVGGSHVLIQDGEPSELGSGQSARHPRTAIGIDKDGFIYLVVVDGRSSASVGMSLSELQLYLSQLGLVNAINLDGGGSSTMVLQESVVNTPSDGRERSVAAVVEVAEQRGTCWHELIRC